MEALSALRPAAGALRRNPVLFVVPAVLALLQLPQLVVQTVSPFVGGIVSLLLSGVMLLALPFLQAGLIAMAHEALDGQTRLATLVAAGKEYYVPVFLAFGVLFVCNLVVFGLVFVGVFVAVVVGLSQPTPSTGVFLAVAVFGLLVFGLYLLVVFFLQFYVQAIVLDDLGPFAGLKRSASVVRSHLGDTFVYSLVGGGIGALFGLFGAVFSILLTSSVATSPTPTPLADVYGPLADVSLSLPLLVVGFLALVLLTTLFGGFFGTYSVAFYRAIRPTTV